MGDQVFLELPRLSEIEILELRELLPKDALTTIPAGKGGAADYGDFGISAAVVCLAVPAIHGLAVWLAKRRVKTQTVREATLERTAKITIRTESTGVVTESPNAEDVGALESALQSLLSAAGN